MHWNKLLRKKKQEVQVEVSLRNDVMVVGRNMKKRTGSSQMTETEDGSLLWLYESINGVLLSPKSWEGDYNTLQSGRCLCNRSNGSHRSIIRKRNPRSFSVFLKFFTFFFDLLFFFRFSLEKSTCVHFFLCNVT